MQHQLYRSFWMYVYIYIPKLWKKDNNLSRISVILCGPFAEPSQSRRQKKSLGKINQFMFKTYLDEFYWDVTIAPDSPQNGNNGNKCIQKETEISLKIHGLDISYFTESPSIFWVLFFQMYINVTPEMLRKWFPIWCANIVSVIGGKNHLVKVFANTFKSRWWWWWCWWWWWW